MAVPAVPTVPAHGPACSRALQWMFQNGKQQSGFECHSVNGVDRRCGKRIMRQALKAGVSFYGPRYQRRLRERQLEAGLAEGEMAAANIDTVSNADSNQILNRETGWSQWIKKQ